MADKGNIPPGYQAIPQPGSQQPVYPSEPPPKYEDAGVPPQGAYPPQSGYQTHTTLYTHQPVVVVADTQLGPSSKMMQCPNCHATISTSIEYEAGGLTWLSAGIVCIVGCWLGCCLVPFCINDLQDVKHSCPNCRKQIGVFRRL